jgi:hypothetical protein
MDYYYRLFVKLIRSFVNLIVVIIHLPSYFTVGKLMIKANGEINLLGNGPSLKDDYPVIVDLSAKDKSFMVVNAFASTEYFELIKPAYYLLVDSAFFLMTEDHRFTELQKSITSAINEKTKWKMTLLLPASAKKSPFVKSLSGNEFISIVYLRNMAVYDGSEKFNRFLYKHGLANPPFRNVLIAAIYFSIIIGFKNINIWGADHSWHENLILGKDNKLYVKDKHFFDDDPQKRVHCDVNGMPIKVHEEFFSIYKALKIYHVLEPLSRSFGCKIINKSSKTWIDAFERG